MCDHAHAAAIPCRDSVSAIMARCYWPMATRMSPWVCSTPPSEFMSIMPLPPSILAFVMQARFSCR